LDKSSRIIAPSMLACNFGKLEEEISLVNNSNQEVLNLDFDTA